MSEDWPTLNRERGELIDKNIAGTLTAAEQERLDWLQDYAEQYIHSVAPRPTHLLEELESIVEGKVVK